MVGQPENWKKAITSKLYNNNANKFQITADVKLKEKCCFLDYVISNKINNTKKALWWTQRNKNVLKKSYSCILCNELCLQQDKLGISGAFGLKTQPTIIWQYYALYYFTMHMYLPINKKIEFKLPITLFKLT